MMLRRCSRPWWQSWMPVPDPVQPEWLCLWWLPSGEFSKGSTAMQETEHENICLRSTKGMWMIWMESCRATIFSCLVKALKRWEVRYNAGLVFLSSSVAVFLSHAAGNTLWTEMFTPVAGLQTLPTYSYCGRPSWCIVWLDNWRYGCSFMSMNQLLFHKFVRWLCCMMLLQQSGPNSWP